MKRFFTPISKSSFGSSSPSNTMNVEVQDNGKKPRVEIDLSDDDIVGDPGLRKPIDSYHINIRDELRRRYLTKGPCQPYGNNFPQTNFSGGMRSFQKQWFEDFDWLEYSVAKDAAFCFVCYLFSRGHKRGDNVFTEIGFKNWKKAKDKFREHEGGQGSIHRYAKIQYSGFKNKRQNVDYVLSQQSRPDEIAYRTRLTTVVDVIRFLLENGLAFRGNDESDNSMQLGNFLGLLKWECRRHPEIDKVMNSNASGNNQLASPKIQKDIINACATEVRKAIVNEIGSKFFSLLIDEACNSSVKEQMSVVLRFVNDCGEVIERFLGVVHVTDTSAHSLKNAIDDFFAKNGLLLSKVRGQGYHGASNMRGEINGLKQKILDENKSAHYVHSFAHRLQLVVVATSKNHGKVGSFFDYLIMIVNVVGALCKRKDNLLQKHHEGLVKCIESGEISTGKGKNQETSLARPDDTRWGCHFETISRVLHMWDAVMEVLETIYDDAVDAKNKSVASSLIDKMGTFHFVFIAHLMLQLLEKTNSVSKVLQQKNQNISNAVVFVHTMKDDLKNYRDEYGWNGLLEVVTTFCSKQNISVPNMEEAMPGRVKRQMTVDGKVKTYYYYFHVDIFVEVIDRIIQEMDTRFNEFNSELLMGIACLSPKDSFSNFDHKRLLRLAELYPNDFNSKEKDQLNEELRLFITFVKSNPVFSDLQNIGDLAKRMVKTEWHTSYRLVYRLIELALVLPVATATVERSFSSMKFVKNDLCNKIGDAFLTDCLVCYVENEIFGSIENEVIMERFQSMAPQRQKLSPVNHSSSSDTLAGKKN